MAVPVRWILAQRELALELKAGATGLDREVTLALTTELPEPFQWLSGGEFVLTTGLRLPLTRSGRARYLARLHESGVAAVGFGTGLTHPTVPEDMVAAADGLGLPLLEVPLATPFNAVTKRIMGRLAELQYEAVLRASRAQPRMTRAVVQGGAAAILRELAGATGATAVLLDRRGRSVASHPARVDEATAAEIQTVLTTLTGPASSGVSLGRSGSSITVQRIGVGTATHGHLALLSPAPLSSVDQILLGHANSLLALDYEKPQRLLAAQNRLNGFALALVLAEAGDTSPARSLLGPAADDRDAVRALTVMCEHPSAVAKVADAVERAMREADRPLFMTVRETDLAVLLRGSDTPDTARALLRGLSKPVLRSLRVGVSTPLPLAEAGAAVGQSRRAASAAESGGTPLEFSALAGNALLATPASRQVLDDLARDTVADLAEHDRRHGTELVVSLRAYLEANGHWESAATNLGVHRHTLRSRMARVEALLDCRLDVARVRAELLLATIAWQSK
ncbi:PucR family transcriptional regulator [Rhodococcus spelaei]|uniref:PucR family transcriptional regulator n=1 Tax=Rhodococcus spelaei TaxID=2546320 RepID=A0A541BMS6_9NOCA|nr:PucR family transcriptional regulator [Rhodococcus spelaei]TQF73619.1 PucR family transcriptional regulator [Rhodococcus spelaei]